MKKVIKIVLVVLACLFLLYQLYESLADAAYDKQHWIYRKMSDSIKESIERGVFVKELHFKIDSFSGPSFQFEVFIEKAFTHGHQSVNETILMADTKFPYSLSFNSRPRQEVGVFIRPNELNKFDSANAVWGFLKRPVLHDTVILEIRGEGLKYGLIKVWQ